LGGVVEVNQRSENHRFDLDVRFVDVRVDETSGGEQQDDPERVGHQDEGEANAQEHSGLRGTGPLQVVGIGPLKVVGIGPLKVQVGGTGPL